MTWTLPFRLACITYLLTSVTGCVDSGGGPGPTAPVIPQSQGWGTEEHIDGIPDLSTQGQHVYFDDAGNAFAIWTEWSGGNAEVWAGRYDSANGWVGAASLESDTDEVLDPVLAFDGSGNAIAVWVSRVITGTQPTTYTWSVKANIYDVATSSWSATPVTLATGSMYRLNGARIAMASGGDAIVVWEHQDIDYTSGIESGQIGRIESVFYNAAAPAGTRWGTPVPVSMDNTRSAGTPSVRMDNNGNAIAVWARVYGAVGNINSAHIGPTGGWSAAQSIESQSLSAIEPDVATDLSGNAIAIWHQYDGAGITHVWGNAYRAN